MKFTNTITALGAFTTLANGLNILPAARSVPLNGGTLSPSLLTSRTSNDDITITCTNNSIDYVSAQTAALKLGTWCSSQAIDASSKVSFTEGKTRVYACNWASGGDNDCSHDEIVRAQNAIASKCGLNMGGIWYRASWDKTYGNDAFDGEWCDGLVEEQDGAAFETDPENTGTGTGGYGSVKRDTDDIEICDGEGDKTE